MRNAGGQRLGLAGPCPGEHQNRAVQCLDRFALRGVQIVQIGSAALPAPRRHRLLRQAGRSCSLEGVIFGQVVHGRQPKGCRSGKARVFIVCSKWLISRNPSTSCKVILRFRVRFWTVATLCKQAIRKPCACQPVGWRYNVIPWQLMVRFASQLTGRRILTNSPARADGLASTWRLWLDSEHKGSALNARNWPNSTSIRTVLSQPPIDPTRPPRQ